MKKKFGLAALGALVSIAALVWVGKGIAWDKLGHIFSGLPLWLPVAAACIYVFSFIPRAIRSRCMLAGAGSAPLLLKHTGEAQIIGYAANNLLPLRLGEFVRVFVLRKTSGVPAPTGLASLLAERILDGVIMMLILGITVAWFAAKGMRFGGTAVQTLLFVGMALFAVAAVSLVILASLSGWISGLSSRFLPHRLHGAVGSMLDALAFLRDPVRALTAVLLSAFVWLLEGAVFVMAVFALGVRDPLMVGFLMLAVINLGILLPSAPGYVGLFQACGMLAFQVLGLPREQGLAASVIVHACQFFPITAIGLILASRHGWKLRTMADPKINS